MIMKIQEAFSEEVLKTPSPGIEHICCDSRLIAIIVSHLHNPENTNFLTASDINLQVGFIKYPREGVIQSHVHLPLERHIVGTNEVLFVRSGKMQVYLFNERRELIAERILSQGDLLVLISGGHGFRMLEDTVLLEIKQGPYTGLDEKERFEYDPGQ
jgi:cupin fold WbuC family metalloprotein